MDSGILASLTKALSSPQKDDLVEDPLRLKGYLKDTCPAFKKEIAMLISFQIGHFAAELSQSSPDLAEMAFLKIAERFSGVSGYERKNAEWCVLVWSHALGKKLSFNYKSLKYPAPAIENFKLSETEVVAGTVITLTWEVKNAVKVILISGTTETEVKESGHLQKTINGAEIIALKAIGFFEHAVESYAPVTIIQKPVITRFCSSEDKIISGNPVRLSWTVEHATAITLSGSTRSYAPCDEEIVYPVASTTYTLTAENKAALITAKTGIRVIQIRTPGKELFLKLPQPAGFVFRQKRMMRTVMIKHNPVKITFPAAYTGYRPFRTPGISFILRGLRFIKTEALKIVHKK